MNNLINAWAVIGLLVLPVSNGNAVEVERRIEPLDAQGLTLQQVFQRAVDRYPLLDQLPALEQEATALKKWGDSLIAGAPSFSFRFQDDRTQNNTGLVEYEAGIDLPLWRWGQRQASQIIAQSASDNVDSQSRLLQYKVASLLRSIIWNLRLKQNDLDFSENNAVLISKLVNTVRRRVELGSLAKADLLLAETEFKARQIQVEEIRSEVEAAREDYLMLTNLKKLPEFFEESSSDLNHISDDHPLLAERRSHIEQLNAKLDWERRAGSGQPVLTVGVRSEKPDRHSETVDSLGIAISLPFGGSVHQGPVIASVNRQIIAASSQFELLKRELQRDLHKIRKKITIDQKKVVLAEARSKIAKEHLTISRIGFKVGKISLINMLKIQEKAQQAFLSASRQKIIMQRNFAQLNQVIGRLP